MPISTNIFFFAALSKFSFLSNFQSILQKTEERQSITCRRKSQRGQRLHVAILYTFIYEMEIVTNIFDE